MPRKFGILRGKRLAFRKRVRKVFRKAGINYTSVHYFKRMLQTANIYCKGVGKVLTVEDSNIPGGTVTWLPNVDTPGVDLLAGTIQFGLGCNFKLSDCISPTELTLLFDQYQIIGVDLQIDLITSSSIDFANRCIPVIQIANDYDDDVAPTTMDYLGQYDKVKTFKLTENKTVKWSTKPRCAVMVYRTIATTGYSKGRANQWIDCETYDIPHYGLKMFVGNFQDSTAEVSAIRITPVMRLGMKDAR